MITSLVAQFGYWAVFIGAIFEGETILILGSIAAYENLLSLPLVVTLAIVASMIGDQAFFFFGRIKGRPFIAARPQLATRALKINQLLARHGLKLIIVARFMYGLRSAVPMIIGASAIRTRTFLLGNLLGAILWATTFSLAGYLFGSAFEALVGDVRRNLLNLGLGIVLISLLGNAFWRLGRRFIRP